jgi:hypothetical protein
MPMLYVRCEACGHRIPTGLDVDYETFRDMTFSERSVECANCEMLQVWNLDDVDVTVFPRPPRK